MGMADKQRAIYEQLGNHMKAQLVPGETLKGVITANQQKTFSANFYAIGTTDQRLILQPVTKKWQPDGEAISVHRGDITSSSVWGKGGGFKTWASMSAGQELRFEANGTKWKFMALGGNLLEDLLANDEQVDGLDHVVEFLLSAQNP